jgi:hypothetical protein
MWLYCELTRRCRALGVAGRDETSVRAPFKSIGVPVPQMHTVNITWGPLEVRSGGVDRTARCWAARIWGLL